METPTEITVILKDSERSYRHKFLTYAKYYLEPQNEIVQDCIKEALKSFGENPEDPVTIKIKATLELR